MPIKYVGDEVVGGILCQKYEHQTQGILAKLLGAKGHLWMAKEDPRHYAVKYTSHLRRNRIWKDFSLQLKEIKSMGLDEWETFLEEKTDEANRFFGMD